MIRKILVPVRGDGKGDNVIAHAAALSQGAHSHISIIHCRSRAEDLMPFGIALPEFLRSQIAAQAAQIADLEESGLKEELVALAKKLELNLSGTPNDRPSAEWLEEPGRMIEVIKRNGRLADVIAVAQPDVDRNLGFNSLKAALFDSGRPVLMVPNDVPPPAKLGEKITVGWNGSLEASRAVTMTLPILRHAKEVTILSTGAEPNAASARELVVYLRAHEIQATIERFEKSRNVAPDLLAMSKKLGADTLIMGAYGDSHERETVFGGNTQHIVDKAKMPVILVH